MTSWVPELFLNETRQDETGGHCPNWRDRDNTTFSGPVAWENPGKIQEKSGKNPGNKRDGTGRDYSLPLWEVLSGK